MNTRMPSTQTTIPIPPMVMTTAAARSVRLTPARRLVDASTFSRTVSGDASQASGAPPATMAAVKGR